MHSSDSSDVMGLKLSPGHRVEEAFCASTRSVRVKNILTVILTHCFVVKKNYENVLSDDAEDLQDTGMS